MKVQRVEPIRNQVAQLLRTAISDLQFKPGQVLVERELCEMTGASRPSVREALRQLESEGLVTSKTGKGTVVSSMTPVEAAQVCQIRAVLEGLAGRLFTENATAEQRAELVDVVNRFEAELDNPDRLMGIKNEFYRVLLEGSGNELAAQMTVTLQRRSSLLRATSLMVPGRPKQTVKELRAILAAIKKNDADKVEQLCRDHVNNIYAAAIERLPDPVSG
ncbi:GntR family transcriptional regulator [Mycolicibacterium sp.]|uniref:GntR family transcriptional regulator n=1 Tax=Mycolicibacterium sp. TaxID=2320850 RepID=UPI003D140BB4